MREPWWRSAVVYQVYPRSFADASGDGVGDLEGVRQHLDHLEWLGVDAMWLSPFYRSPMADFGYDVCDYCDVDPVFGTLEDFDRLLADAHGRGIKVLVDWVPNHTSDRHPWFAESRSSRQSPKRDWYIWRDGRDGGPPNNWRAAFGGEAWTLDEATGQWYLHLFLPEQPDLNWRNPEVAEAMHATLRFWLDRGVDGFRVDVAHGLGKDEQFTDVPAAAAGTPQSSRNDHPDTHRILRGLRAVVDSYPGDRVLVGEVYLLSTPQVARYLGRGDELHLAFDFTPLLEPWDAGRWRQRVAEVEAEVGKVGGCPTWVMSNHDNPRHRTRYGGSEARARAAAVLLLTLRGTAFLYQGEELGLLDAEVSPERAVDPGGRDGCRAPIAWDASPSHGWPAEPWLPWAPEAEVRNAASLAHEPGSILHLYRRLLAARRASPALARGSLELVDASDAVLAYTRRAGSDHRAVAVNFSDREAPMTMPGRWTVEVASDGQGEGQAFAERLGGNQAVLLSPT